MLHQLRGMSSAHFISSMLILLSLHDETLLESDVDEGLSMWRYTAKRFDGDTLENIARYAIWCKYVLQVPTYHFSVASILCLRCWGGCLILRHNYVMMNMKAVTSQIISAEVLSPNDKVVMPKWRWEPRWRLRWRLRRIPLNYFYHESISSASLE